MPCVRTQNYITTSVPKYYVNFFVYNMSCAKANIEWLPVQRLMRLLFFVAIIILNQLLQLCTARTALSDSAIRSAKIG